MNVKSDNRFSSYWDLKQLVQSEWIIPTLIWSEHRGLVIHFISKLSKLHQSSFHVWLLNWKQHCQMNKTDCLPFICWQNCVAWIIHTKSPAALSETISVWFQAMNSKRCGMTLALSRFRNEFSEVKFHTWRHTHIHTHKSQLKLS